MVSTGDAAFLVCSSCVFAAVKPLQVAPHAPLYACFVQLICAAAAVNILTLRWQTAQLWLHTAFVGLNVFGSLHWHSSPRNLCALCTALTMGCRALFDRCVFMWWMQPPRNVENDIFASLLLALNLSRRPCRPAALIVFVSVTAAYCAHNVEDLQQNALVLRT